MNPKERIYIIPTWAGILFAVTIFLVFAAGYVSRGFGGTPQVLVIALVVAGIIVLIQTNDNLRGILLTSVRCCPTRAGGLALVEVAVTNRSTTDRFGLRVRLRERWKLRCSASIPVLRAGATERIELRLPASTRGEFPIPPVWISSTFPAGLCFAWKVFADAGRILVFPRGRSWRDLAGILDREGCDDVAGHRGYIPGDPIGRVDWKLYAKSGWLAVRSLDAPHEDFIRWQDTAFLNDNEDRLEQMTAWLDECEQRRKPFRFHLGNAVLNDRHIMDCRAALAEFRPGEGAGKEAPPETPSGLQALVRKGRIKALAAEVFNFFRGDGAVDPLAASEEPGVPHKPDSAREKQAQQVGGWFLALWFALHLVWVPLPDYGASAILAVLAVGGLLRGVGATFSRGWLGIPAIAGIPFLPGAGLVASVACASAWCGALLLLGPLTPRRGAGILLCAIFLLGVASLEPATPVALLVADVAVLLLFVQSLHTPVAIGLRVLLERALRLAIPVALIVSLAFAVFGPIAGRTQFVFAGYSGELNPGRFTSIRPSHRVAMVAHFPDALPPSSAWFWRGQTLRINQGLRWRREPGQPEVVSPGPRDFRYTLRPGYDNVLVPLDLPVPETTDAGAEELVYAASLKAPTDQPGAADLEIPPEIASDEKVRQLVSTLIPPGTSTPEAIGSLLVFFRDGGFRYSLDPGRATGVQAFLLRNRRGYCEHYAASSANLLRMAGIPARVVTGYRGGRWNPWLKTITVRDSDAHAWVESWDPVSRTWLRFDPTSTVAPDFSARMLLEGDPSTWAWYRVVAAFTEALASRVAGAASAAAEVAGPWILGALLVGWLVRACLRTWRTESARTALVAAERRAKRHRLTRKTGETPLAWLARLANSVHCEPGSVRRMAEFYESEVYAVAGPDNGGKQPRRCPRIRWRRN